MEAGMGMMARRRSEAAGMPVASVAGATLMRADAILARAALCAAVTVRCKAGTLGDGTVRRPWTRSSG